MKVPAILMLAALPPAIFKKAINNADKYPLQKHMIVYCDNLAEAIASEFIWSRTPEGLQYWAYMFRKFQ